MEAVWRAKKSLKTPIRKLSCVSGVKDKKLCAKTRGQQNRARGGHGRRNVLGKAPPVRGAHPNDPTFLRSYQADLEKKRKLREAMNAQKNAQRAAVRSHFRTKYQLAECPKDSNHLRSFGAKVSLPHELSKMIHPETNTKDDNFNLLSAFRGLSFSMAALTGEKSSRTTISTAAKRDSCRVM